MIVFDLRCGGSHVFEAWFGSSDDYESQVARGLIACPLCGNSAVSKAVMAPAVGTKGNRSGAGVDVARAAMLAEQRKMEAASDYVGGNFAVAARERHEAVSADSDTPVRGIYGEATMAEARSLLSDGIAVMPLPFTPLVRSDA